MLKRILQWFETGSETESQPLPPKLAAAALLVEVMAADDHWQAAEEEAIQRLLVESLTLTEEEARELAHSAQQEQKSATDLFEMTKQINLHFDTDQKYKLVLAMWTVAYADGELDRYEDHIIRRISELLYVPHEQFIRAKLQAKPD